MAATGGFWPDSGRAAARSTRQRVMSSAPGRSHSAAALALNRWHEEEAPLKEPLASGAHRRRTGRDRAHAERVNARQATCTREPHACPRPPARPRFSGYGQRRPQRRHGRAPRAAGVRAPRLRRASDPHAAAAPSQYRSSVGGTSSALDRIKTHRPLQWTHGGPK
jgi:hypothetical protein